MEHNAGYHACHHESHSAECEATLNVEHLSVQIGNRNGEFYAVRDVSFSIAPGEAFGFVGESGCGKSMTARAILGLIPQSARARVEGKISLGGFSIQGLSESKMRSIRGLVASIIFQDPMTALTPFFTIGFQLVETLRAHRSFSQKEAWKRAGELLGEVGISEPEKRLNQYPHEFSGGMRQRVVIAMALAHRPKLLIADEPTTGLDASTQVEILDLLSYLRGAKIKLGESDCGAQPMSIMFISHDFSAVKKLCDRVAVMYAGQIVELGPASETLSHPSHPYTDGLIHCLPQWRPRSEYELHALQGFPPPLDRVQMGCSFLPRCSRGEARHDLCAVGQVEWTNSMKHISSTGAEGVCTSGVRCHFPALSKQESRGAAFGQ